MKRNIAIPAAVILLGIAAYAWSAGKKHPDTIVNNYPIKFDLAGPGDNTTSLESFSGKVVVVNFWASWCRPCAYEMPDLQKFYDTYKGKDVVVMAVALDNSFEASKAFMKRGGYSIPFFRPNGPIPSQFEVSAIPVTFVINTEGNIVATYTGMTDFSASYFLDEIQKLL
jgi:thiol-disulfide isomerase/thioredoxin